jgi:hypothetical protein
MLEREYMVLLEGLGPRRGDRSAFFVFADTVATRSYSRRENGHGWLGIRFQTQAGGGPSDVLIHVYPSRGRLSISGPRAQQESGDFVRS